MLKFYSVDWRDVVRQSNEVLERLQQEQARQAGEQASMATAETGEPGFVYRGNDAMPRALLLDRRLTPLERNTWQVLRWLVGEKNLRAPRYEDLQPYLATSPCGAQASRETIARALNVLRVTRWLTLVERARDEHGCLRGCVYELHDDPLTPAEAVARDTEYMALIKQALSHAIKGVRDVARHVLEELRADPAVPGDALQDFDVARPTSPQQVLALEPDVPRNSERTSLDPVRAAAVVGEHPEPSGITKDSLAVRNPDTTRTVQKEQSKKSTVPLASAGTSQWPDGLQLSPGEQRMAAQALHQLDPEQRQAVINEAAVRCARGEIRKPIAYLMGLIKRACRGEFTLWAARGEVTGPTPAVAAVRPSAPVIRAAKAMGNRNASPLALACLEELKLRCRLISGTP
ncbi:STY4528 family pathogenicity island replication protein [Pseudomonas sp. App30]|uniref:STY4528 family pathogenicity island replication protein n=1 Tax=Pseudomonas sp. App30 TaxID=3068990 RepID=UPI003A808E44